MQRERGSSLLLFPAAILVVLLLAAICVDFSRVHLARRALVHTLSVAADDAVAMVNEAALRSGQPDRVDLDRARQVIRFELAVGDLPGPVVGAIDVRYGPNATSLIATATIRVDHIFAPAVPGASRSQDITATVSSALENR